MFGPCPSMGMRVKKSIGPRVRNSKEAIIEIQNGEPTGGREKPTSK